jgi:hypothetical protein
LRQEGGWHISGIERWPFSLFFFNSVDNTLEGFYYCCFPKNRFQFSTTRAIFPIHSALLSQRLFELLIMFLHINVQIPGEDAHFLIFPLKRQWNICNS